MSPLRGETRSGTPRSSYPEPIRASSGMRRNVRTITGDARIAMGTRGGRGNSSRITRSARPTSTASDGQDCPAMVEIPGEKVRVGATGRCASYIAAPA